MANPDYHGEAIATKRCPICGTLRPVEAFYVRRRTADGRQAYCKECCRTRSVTEETKRKRLARQRKRLEDSPELRERAREASRRYGEAHKEEIRERARVLYVKNREAMTARKERYKRAHADRFRVLRYLHRCGAQATPVPMPTNGPAQRAAMFGNACYICRGPFTMYDHVKPASKGGLNVLANLRPICRSCNSQKHDRWAGVAGLRSLMDTILHDRKSPKRARRRACQKALRDRHREGLPPKGRVRGECNTKAKLTEDIVREMRRLRAEEGLSFVELGKRFGVNRHNARGAVLGITWAHVK